jgi:outer membrane protein assembly factor BamB
MKIFKNQLINALTFFIILMLFIVSFNIFFTYRNSYTDSELQEDNISEISPIGSNDNINHEFDKYQSTLTSNSRAPVDIKYWATFQFDYHNTGNTSSKAPDTNNTLWVFKECKGEIYGSPVVVGNLIYFTATDGYLYCVDLINGTQKWKRHLLQNSYATPTVFNGYVYVGSGTEMQNSDNRLFCINGANGNIVWSEPLMGPTLGSPIVLNDPTNRIYIGTLNDNKIYSYNPSIQEISWEFEVPNGGKGGSDGIWNSMAYYNIANGWLLFAVNSETNEPNKGKGLYCLDLSVRDDPRWHFLPEVGSDFVQTYSGPTIFQDKVLIGMGVSGERNYGVLYCLDIGTGSVIWSFKTGAGASGYGVTTSAAVAYDQIFFGSCDGKLYSLDLNGNHLWNFTTNDKDDGIYSSPAVADGKVFFGSSDNIFYCLNAYNGSLIWKYELDEPKGMYGVVSAPAVAYNRVFVAGNNGNLYCFGGTAEEPPTISIQKPIENEMVKGEIEISGVADDDSEVTLVQIKIDNGNWSNTSGIYSWSYKWNTTLEKDGPHMIYARAFDKNGFSMTNITVIVNNGPSELLVYIKSHVDGQTVIGITRFYGTAYSSVNTVEEIQINIGNESAWEHVEGTYDWFYHWDSTHYSDGDYYVQFRASDGYNYSEPIGIWITVFNYEGPNVESTPMFRGNRNRIGVYSSAVPNSTEIFWTNDTKFQMESSGIYYNDRIYYGSDNRLIYCVDDDPSDGIDEGIPDHYESTCDVIWTYETANAVKSTPVIAEKRLFIGSNDYYLYCLNAQTGERIWRTRTGGAIESSPLVVNDSVYVGSFDGKIYCINVSDGKKIWSRETGDEIWGSPAYHDGFVYIGSIDGKMYCYWANNGTPYWNFSSNLASVKYGIYSTPAIANNKILFGSEDNFVYCLDSTNGNLIWKFKTNGYVYSSLAIYKDVVFTSNSEGMVGTEFREGYLYALPLEDTNFDGVLTPNEVLWKVKTHDFDGGSSPAVSTISEKVVIGSNEFKSGGIGKLYCFDVETGEEYWNFTINGDIHGSPLIANNKIYVGSLNGEFYCIGTKGSSGNGGNGGNGGEQNETQIFVDITIPQTEVLSGHSIKNITITVFTENGTPVKGARLDLTVNKGTLSDYGATVFDNGTYPLSHYVAPTVKKEVHVTLTVLAFTKQKGYKNGSMSVNITVKPLDTDGDGQKDKKEDNLFEEMGKPKYFLFWIIVFILVIMTIIIYTLLIRTKRKLKRLEQGTESEEIIKKSKKHKHKKKITKDERVPPPAEMAEGTMDPEKFQIRDEKTEESKRTKKAKPGK